MHTRYTEVTLGDTTWKMPVTYAVSRKISQEVRDPLKAALDISRGTFAWSTEEVISIVHIGVQAAGSKAPRSEVAELIFEAGALKYIGVVADYIKALISGDPDKQPPESE